ncbi:MAG: tRNA lysidine(34) synthetase TilS [Prochlorotrichaceae cyanobacterium]
MPDWSPIHAQVHQVLRSRRLLERQQSILAAVSGGQDSLCLLKLMQDLQPRWGWRVGVIHCDHQWRSDSRANAQFVQEWAAATGQVHLCRAAVAPPSEAAARTWRYDCFRQVALEHGYGAVVTGHTASDRAETLLYNLMRGCGSDGLGALQWSRVLGDAPPVVTLVRPLLGLDRSDTAQFCQDFQLPIWQDSTNHDRRYQRNRIRLDLLPYLEAQFNPQVVRHLAQTAELWQGDVEYLEDQARQSRAHLQQGNALDRSGLKQLPLALQRRVIRQFLQEHLPHPPNFDQVDKVLSLVEAGNRSQSDPFPGGTIALVKDAWIILQQTGQG